MKILATICARGGSKGVKNKNIREINGKPLIAYTIEVLKKWGKADHIVCSTDSKEIAEIARKYGAEVPFLRDKRLAQDSSGKMAAIRDAVVRSEEHFDEKYDLVVDLDATAPIRTVEDLDKCLEIYKEKDPDVVFSVVPASKNPYFNMVEDKGNGFVKLVKKLPESVVRRQDTPKVYSMNASIYFYNPKFLLDEKTVSVTGSERIAVHVMDEISGVDIDKEIDFDFIEFLIKNKRVNL